MDSKSTRGSGWQHIRTSEDETYVMIFDVYILYENSGRKSTGSDWKTGRNQDWKARLKNFSVSKAAQNISKGCQEVVHEKYENPGIFKMMNSKMANIEQIIWFSGPNEHVHSPIFSQIFFPPTDIFRL